MEQSKIIDMLETYQFTIVLYDFGMIWLELTRTDAVFSRTTVVLFLCFIEKEYQTESNWPANFCGFFMDQKKPPK